MIRKGERDREGGRGTGKGEVGWEGGKGLGRRKRAGKEERDWEGGRGLGRRKGTGKEANKPLWISFALHYRTAASSVVGLGTGTVVQCC